MLISFNFSNLENFFVVFYLSFNFILAPGASAHDALPVDLESLRAHSAALFPCTRGSYANQSTKKEKLVCESCCHGCPALHRRAGPVAPGDNHSLAEGHLLRVDARVAKPASLLNVARIKPEIQPKPDLARHQERAKDGKAR